MNEYKLVRGIGTIRGCGSLAPVRNDDFEASVAKLLVEGWTCLGGVAVVMVETSSGGDGNLEFIQALGR